MWVWDNVISFVLDLSFLADLSSMLGLMITIFVARSLGDIKRKFIFNARVGEYLKEFEEISSEMSKYLSDFDSNVNYLVTEIGKVRSNLDSISKKAKKDIKRRANSIIRKIDRSGYKEGLSRENAWLIYTEMNIFIQDLRNVREDMRWGSEYGN
jgi:hypothetical protein